MSETLYLKWRPQTFSDVIGQEQITSTLKNQVIKNSFSHAYLFCGSRGTGKTTCARILAKAINCEHTINGDPCGKCDVCLGVENGELLDVVEVDAASNNGVDYIRDLKEDSFYNPSEYRRKIYIIDEVHMLSPSAFNAFLKLLEEPPEHVVFILATTEVHKLPPTILSRCQRFNFKRISQKDIAERISYIAKQEGYELTEDGAWRIAGLADGAMRNAISMLEQSSSADARMDSNSISESLGFANSDGLMAIANAVTGSDSSNALAALAGMHAGGVSMPVLIEELMMLFRDIAVCKIGADTDMLGSVYSKKDLSPYIQSLGMDKLVYLMQSLMEAAQGIRNSVNPRIDAELLLIRMCNPAGRSTTALAARIEALEKKLDGYTYSPSVKNEQKDNSESQSRSKPAVAEEKEYIIPEKAKPSVNTAEPDSSEPLTPVPYRDAFLNALKKTMGILDYTQISIAGMTGREGVLHIICSDKYQYEVLSKTSVIKTLKSTLSDLLGKNIEIFVDGNAETKKENDNFAALLNYGREHSDIINIK